ncbi:MAG: ABC transporter permease, partial [Alphaproteobacteria bacterium]
MREVLLSLTWARRELRTGITGFWVFLACLALGVGAIAGVGAVSLSIQEALSRDARALAGGDVTVRTTYEPPGAAQMAFLNAQATRLSRSIEMRVMAGGQDADERRLAELKAIDNVYPLYGSLVLAPAMALADALALKDGVWGAVAAQGMLDAQG